MLRQLYHQLLVYRSIVYPFLVVSAIAVPLWLVFRMYRLRTAGHRVSFQREFLLLTLVFYLSGLVAATLLPNYNPRLRAEPPTVGIELRPNLASLTCSSANLPEGSKARHFCIYNAKGNVALFFPLGILIPLVWGRLRFFRGIQIAVALSSGVEIVQYVSRAWGSYRAADINDVILNFVGASLGMALVFLLRLLRGSRPGVPQETATQG